MLEDGPPPRGPSLRNALKVYLATPPDYQFEDLGIHWPDSFPGVSTVFTPWTAVYVGIGDTPREAAEDALTEAASEWDVEHIPNEFPETPSVYVQTRAETRAQVATDDENSNLTAEEIDNITDDLMSLDDLDTAYHHIALYIGRDPKTQ